MRALVLAAQAFAPPPPAPAIDPFALLGYTPTPKQAEFHAATEYDVLYGGAAGGGKTRALVADDLRDAIRYPGIRIGAFRRTYDELAESLLKELAGFDFAEALGAKWNGTTRELIFPNKSRIRYRYAESVVDATRRQGGEYQKITIDERTLMAPEVVEILSERLRTSRATVPVIGLRSGTNPGGPGHGPTKTRFIDATKHGAQVVKDEQGRTLRFIPARVDDNPHIDAGYKAQLDAISDPARRRAMRDGDWDVFAGQVFEQWRRDRHVIAPMPMSLEWPRHVGIDYGYAAPWVVLWAAVDNDRRVWVYRELSDTKVIEREQARRILELEVTDRTEGVRHADPSMWAQTGEAPSPAMTYAAEGVALVKAINDRLPGWQAIHSLLAEAPACSHHRALGWETCPRLHVSEACAGLIRTLPALPRDPRRPEDVDTKAADHWADALRYLVMGATAASAPVDLDAHRTRRHGLRDTSTWGAPDVDVLTADF